MEKRLWAMVIKRFALQLCIIFIAGLIFDYFAGWDTPVTTGLVSLAVFFVAATGVALVNLVTNILSMYVISTAEMSLAILGDLRSARIPPPRDRDPKNHSYLGVVVNDTALDTDARLRAAFLNGVYKQLMNKGLFASIRFQDAMDAAVLRHYHEGPKRD